jgi:hypothetical protein
MEIEIKETEIKNIKENATEVKSCKSCSGKFTKSQKWILAFSVYLFGTSVYGTYELVQLLISLF